MFTISITESNDELGEITRYQQSVDYLDIRKVIEAVNDSPPPPVRKRAVRSDAGKPRGAREDLLAENTEPNPFDVEVK
jgi:hypothetical protein